MTFDNIYSMLAFYFNRAWIQYSAPRQLGNHSMIFIKGGTRYLDAKEVWDVVIKIAGLIDSLSKRDQDILSDLFTKGSDIRDIAKRRHLTERRIRQIRKKTIDSLHDKCVEHGIIMVKKFDPLP